MSKRISQARIQRKQNEKLRKKAKEMMLKNYSKLMADPEIRQKTFDAIDNANVAVDSNGKLQIFYKQDNKDLSKLN